MELCFTPKALPLPYAIVATNLLLKKPNVTLKLSTSNPLCLTIPATPDSTSSCRLTDKVSILRYLVRASSNASLSSDSLYSETKPAVAADIDQWLDRVRVALSNGMTPKDMIQLTKLIQEATTKSQFLVAQSTSLTLADLAVWGTIHSHDKLRTPVPFTEEQDKFVEWMKRMDAQAECSQALKIVNEIVDSAAAAYATTVDSKAESDLQVNPSDIKDGNVLDLFRKQIGEELCKLVPDFDAATLASYLEIPRGPNAGSIDFALAVPRLRMKGNLPQLAQELAAKVPSTLWIEKADAAGPFVNFYIRKDVLRNLLIPIIREMHNSFGTNTLGSDKKVIVEFSSPNIAKPFHAGHLRSTIIGNFIRNVCKAHGMKTTAINYLGDWGKQYGLLAVGFNRFGSEEHLSRDPIQHLYEVYVKINKEAENDPSIHDEARTYFKRMEDGDQSALALWKRFRDLSIVKYKQIYARLNVEFDIYSGESQYMEGMKRALNRLKEKQLLTESKGAMIVDLEKYKLTPAIVQKADGATLYITRDIAAAWERYDEFKFDQMIYTVAAAQNLHFQQLFKILDLSGFEWSKKCQHINFGMVNGMSTRRGTVVFLEDILDEAKTVMHEVMQKNERVYSQIEKPLETADIIGTSAVIIQDFGARRIKDYEFNWDRMTSFQGDTGPFLQYAHARLCSIERKYLESIQKEFHASAMPDVPFSSRQLHLLKEEKPLDLLVYLAQYPEIIASIPGKQFEPNALVIYLMALCHQVSSCLDDIYVMGREKEVAEARFWLYWCCRVVVGNGMRLLGLKPLERM